MNDIPSEGIETLFSDLRIRGDERALLGFVESAGEVGGFCDQCLKVIIGSDGLLILNTGEHGHNTLVAPVSDLFQSFDING